MGTVGAVGTVGSVGTVGTMGTVGTVTLVADVGIGGEIVDMHNRGLGGSLIHQRRAEYAQCQPGLYYVRVQHLSFFAGEE